MPTGSATGAFPCAGQHLLDHGNLFDEIVELGEGQATDVLR